jgi:hypothetical protein
VADPDGTGRIRVTRKRLALPQRAALRSRAAVTRVIRQMGAEAMGLYVLDVVLWILGIRGHIPHHDSFGPGRGASSVADGGNPLRILAAFALSVAFLSLALWAVVWLAVRLL